MRNLVIVESAAKAKTIQSYLNAIPELKDKGSFVLVASLGHIVDLPKKNASIDKSTWNATYTMIPGKSKIIKRLQEEVSKADNVYLASDPDLEGEAIAFHLKNTLHLSKPMRITFHEITKNALKEAVLNPTKIDKKRVQAQEARRILDRVVGYELSPLLWRRFASSGLSAGRVQSAALKVLVDTMNKAKEHAPAPYWQMEGKFSLDGNDLVATAYDCDSRDAAIWDKEEDARAMLNFLVKKSRKPWKAVVTMKESKRNPSAPFVTSSLQQEAYNRLGLPAKRTMQIAQMLYEKGLITYMRTDSPAMSTVAQKSILEFVADRYGDGFAVPRQFKTKAANAQNAHECIRPTKVSSLPSEVSLDGPAKKVYDLIWRRAVASQMRHATYEELHTSITCEAVPHVFKGKVEILIDEGYLKVYNPSMKASASEKRRFGEDIIVYPSEFRAAGDVSRPPPLLNEPGLVRTLEKAGIGRPSTYATIVDKLVEKGYAYKGSNPLTSVVPVTSYVWTNVDKKVTSSSTSVNVGGTDTDKFIPTSLGERVVDYLSSIVPSLVNTRFTANMELELDKIAEGAASKQTVLSEFYEPFHAAVLTAANGLQKNQDKKHTAVCTPPQNVIKHFSSESVDIVRTRYGVALFRRKDKKFVSVNPFLQWKNKSLDELNERDVQFLYSLPMRFEQTSRTIEMGRYGLYIKDAESNIRLPKTLWDDVYNGTISVQDVMNAQSFAKPKRKT